MGRRESASVRLGVFGSFGEVRGRCIIRYAVRASARQSGGFVLSSGSTSVAAVDGASDLAVSENT